MDSFINAIPAMIIGVLWVMLYSIRKNLAEANRKINQKDATIGDQSVVIDLLRAELARQVYKYTNNKRK